MQFLNLLRKLFVIIGVTAWLAACGGGGGDDNASLTVLTTSPADNATAVAIDTVITASFNKDMDDSTITGSTFTLSTNPPIVGTVTYDPVTNTATFTPDANLDNLTIHTATITTGVTDLTGNNLASDFTWSFSSSSTIGSAVQLPETGQTTCYDGSGNNINCPGTGQDGDILAGISWPMPTRFTDRGDGAITDNLTGIVWLQDADCLGSVEWTLALSSANNLASGSCGLSDGSNAGDWRLPNINELQSLVNAEEVDQSTWLISQGFTGVQPDNYWSSNTYVIDKSAAWRVNMLDGRAAAGVKDCSQCNVWPVHASQ